MPSKIFLYGIQCANKHWDHRAIIFELWFSVVGIFWSSPILGHLFYCPLVFPHQLSTGLFFFNLVCLWVKTLSVWTWKSHRSTDNLMCPKQEWMLCTVRYILDSFKNIKFIMTRLILTSDHFINTDQTGRRKMMRVKWKGRREGVGQRSKQLLSITNFFFKGGGLLKQNVHFDGQQNYNISC